MELMEAIRRRYSCRDYLPRQIPNEKLQIILQAANAAPVGHGRYDEVRLSVVQSPELLEKIDRCSADFLQKPGIHPLYGAPTLILVSVPAEGGAIRDVASCNAACLVENMCLAATEQELASVYLISCAWALQKNAALCRELKIPDTYLPASAIALGYSKANVPGRALTADKIHTEYLR